MAKKQVLNMLCENTQCHNESSQSNDDGLFFCVECLEAMERRERLSKGFDDDTEEHVLDIISKIE